MIKPTVGRVVWFRHPQMLPYHQPYAALVTFVHSDEYVNLIVFDPNGKPFGADSIQLLQEGQEKPEKKNYAEWMPYQIGQAKKHEEVK